MVCQNLSARVDMCLHGIVDILQILAACYLFDVLRTFQMFINVVDKGV